MPFPCYYEPLSIMSTGLFTASSPIPGTQQGLNKQLSYKAREVQHQNSTPDLSEARSTSKLL